MPRWVAKGRIGTLLLASEIPVPIPRCSTVGVNKESIVGIVCPNTSGYYLMLILDYCLSENGNIEKARDE